MSLLLSVAPVLGTANGNNGNNGNNGGGGTGSSNVKVHDASTGVEALGSDNEPHVCDFWLEFSMPDPYEAGTWVLLSWAPTGDGSTVASGTYDTTGDGTDSSSVIQVAAGHYGVEWTATGESAFKKKIFWEEPPAEDVTPPVEEPPAEDVTPPVEEPPADEPATDIGQQDVLSELGAGGESTAEEPASPADEEVEQDPAPPSDESLVTPVNEPAAEAPAQAEDPGATDPGSPPSQDQLDGQGDAGGSTMPDTATSRHVPSGLAATLSLLLVMVWYKAARRFRLLDRG